MMKWRCLPWPGLLSTRVGMRPLGLYRRNQGYTICWNQIRSNTTRKTEGSQEPTSFCLLVPMFKSSVLHSGILDG